jgi:hypothetical protein
MVDIVKLTHSSITRLLHFHKDQCRDGLDLVWGQTVHKAVHQLSPRPKAVAPGDAVLCHTRHGTLKGMAVQV